MSISLDEFKKLTSHNRGFGVKARAIEIFLINNKDKAFTTKEIVKEVGELFKDTNNPEKALSVILNSMLKLNRVLHKRPYWKINDEVNQNG